MTKACAFKSRGGGHGAARGARGNRPNGTPGRLRDRGQKTWVCRRGLYGNGDSEVADVFWLDAGKSFFKSPIFGKMGILDWALKMYLPGIK